jgi:hypothetical protein
MKHSRWVGWLTFALVACVDPSLRTDPERVAPADEVTIVDAESTPMPLGVVVAPQGLRRWLMTDHALSVEVCDENEGCSLIRGTVDPTCDHVGDGLRSLAAFDPHDLESTVGWLARSNTFGVVSARTLCEGRPGVLASAIDDASSALEATAAEVLALAELRSDNVLAWTVTPSPAACDRLLASIEDVVATASTAAGGADVDADLKLVDGELFGVPARLVPTVAALGAIGHPGGGRADVRGAAGFWFLASAPL